MNFKHEKEICKRQSTAEAILAKSLKKIKMKFLNSDQFDSSFVVVIWLSDSDSIENFLFYKQIYVSEAKSSILLSVILETTKKFEELKTNFSYIFLIVVKALWFLFFI